MTTPICEDEGMLQEWAPEYTLMSQIPLKAQRGIFSNDLKLTCVDACPEFITLGTNCGLVYWYCRSSSQLERLRLENTNCSITCVKIVSTVDFMVAAGTDIGNITVFQIPKEHSQSLPDALKPKKRQVERFTINGLHKKTVTCLEWSQNGMKLFSGDLFGTVVLTTIDFSMHLSKSLEVLNEQFEIVQLSYLQNILLVSSTYRTIICNGLNNWAVSQLGSKERKVVGRFGAIFCKFEHGVVIYASRPGQRLWLADKTGHVEQTLIFKGAINDAHASIPILNPCQQPHSPNQNFGKLIQFGEDRLVCYTTEVLFLLHPGAITVVSSLLNARKIISVAVSEDEIFVLEGDRSLLRLSHKPSVYSVDEIMEKNDRRKSFNFDELANKIKDTAVGSFKRMTSELIASNSFEKISPPAVGDEALNMPPVVDNSEESASAFFPEPNVEIHEEEGPSCVPLIEAPNLATSSKFEPEEEPLFRPVKRKKPKKSSQTLQQGCGLESESDSMSATSDDRLVCGIANELSVSEDSPTSWSQSQSTFSILRDKSVHFPEASTSARLHLELPKTPDEKSQASIDTCDSASENLVLSQNLFQEEQAKTFKILANQEFSMLDSFNSERTENMSISVNLTPSSSASSKLSEMVSSETSENISMVSDGESRDAREEAAAHAPPPPPTEYLPPNHSSSISHNKLEHSSPPRRQWNKEMILSQMLGLDLDDPLNRRQKMDLIEKSIEHEEKSIEDTKRVEYECETPVMENIESEESNSLLPESEQQLAGAFIHSGSGAKANESSSKLSSLQGLSYGPPSGSSLLSSCHPSLDLNSGPTVLNNPQALAVDKSDRWLQYKTPEGLKQLALCNNYVMCVDSQDHVSYSRLSGISLTWALLDYSASQVSVSPNAHIVWFKGPRGTRALVNPSPNGPFSEESVEVSNTELLSFSVDNDCAFFVKSDGRIWSQKSLGRFPCGKSVEVPSSWLVKSILSHKGHVMAITSDDGLVCNANQKGTFTSVRTPARNILSMASGPLNLFWVVDSENNIYFSDNVDSENPQWWQVLISEYIFQNTPSTFLSMHNRVKMGAKWEVGRKTVPKQTCIAANDSSVWVYNRFSSQVNVMKSDFSGVRWETLNTKSMLKFKNVSVDGVFEGKGHIWLQSKQGDLFCSIPELPGNIMSVEGPCGSEVVCVAAAPDTLWVLTGEGSVHARLGLSTDCGPGSAWRQLHLPQLTHHRLTWISCGCDVAWCVDVTGRVFITLVPPYTMATSIFDAAWIEVMDGHPKDNAVFVKVFVGPHMYMVWALDSKNQIYVREGIVPEYQVGTGWVHVGGIEAVHLCVSSTAVWAVSPQQQLHRRYGISENNYIGDYWRRQCGAVFTASATFDDQLWGIQNDGCLTQMQQYKVSLSKPEENKSVSIGDDDWLVVG